jgi:hypothetical protein
MTIDKFILHNRVVIPCLDLIVWAKWMETGDRRIALDELDDVRISTVFLGLNMRIGEWGPPHLFETALFKGDGIQDIYRTSTIEQAEEMHEKILNEYLIEKETPNARP